MELRREVKSDPRRGLPAVDRLAACVRELVPDLPDWAIAAAVRETLESERERLAESAEPLGDLAPRAAHRARALSAPHPRRVVNATGVVLHTNLGRAPMAPGAAGRRGDRLGPVAEKLRLLSGAEAALAVNNNAAAVLLALESLARGREVVVSRGELVEIGGSFRVPEIIQCTGLRPV